MHHLEQLEHSAPLSNARGEMLAMTLEAAGFCGD
jgi:hypothetical protein